MIGDHDIVMPEHATQMSRIIPNAQLVILPGPHGSFIGEICAVNNGSKMPEISAELINEFLKK